LDLSLFFHRASVSMNFMFHWVLISMNFMVHWVWNPKNSWFMECSFNEFHGWLGIKFPWISCL